jgi:hypothetical protein
VSKRYNFPVCAGAATPQADFFAMSGVSGLLDNALQGWVHHRVGHACVRTAVMVPPHAYCNQQRRSGQRPTRCHLTGVHLCQHMSPMTHLCTPTPTPTHETMPACPHKPNPFLCTRYFATVFAYGQTGSGKTHTMSGYEGELGEPASVTVLSPPSFSPPLFLAFTPPSALAVLIDLQRVACRPRGMGWASSRGLPGTCSTALGR